MHLSEQTLEDIRAHFSSAYPNEGCGFILKDGSFVAADNIADEPQKHFAISDELYLEHEDNLAAVVHSHTTIHPTGQYGYIDPRTPSAADHEGHIATAVPWGITLCDGENIDPFIWLGETHLIPLYGREFIHGYTDCYAACRDWYRVERDLIIPEFPRELNWWTDESQSLYMDGFKEAGFYEITEEEALPGDAILFRVASRQVNHAGIYLGGTQVFHHLFGRLSTEESYHKYRKNVIAFLRHKELNQPKVEECNEPSSSTAL